jgi:hypothetical protein
LERPFLLQKKAQLTEGGRSESAFSLIKFLPIFCEQFKEIGLLMGCDLFSRLVIVLKAKDRFAL